MHSKILSVILFLFLISCNDDPVSPLLTNSYFPIQMGNSWTFELTYYDTVQQHTYVTYTINSSSTINGKEYFSFDSCPEFIQIPWEFSGADRIYMRNDEDGNVIMRFREREFMFIDFDPQLKDSTIKFATLYQERFNYYRTYERTLHVTDYSMQTETQTFGDGFGFAFDMSHVMDAGMGAVFFKGFGVVRMSYPSEGKIWSLSEATINGNIKERIISITYP